MNEDYQIYALSSEHLTLANTDCQTMSPPHRLFSFSFSSSLVHLWISLATILSTSSCSRRIRYSPSTVLYLHRYIEYMGVSKNRGKKPPNHPFVHRGFPLFSPSILGYHYFWRAKNHISWNFLAPPPVLEAWSQRSLGTRASSQVVSWDDSEVQASHLSGAAASEKKREGMRWKVEKFIL